MTNTNILKEIKSLKGWNDDICKEVERLKVVVSSDEEDGENYITVDVWELETTEYVAGFEVFSSYDEEEVENKVKKIGDYLKKCNIAEKLIF